MSLPTDVLAGPVGVDTGAPLARANPVAKLAVAAVLGLALVLTTDLVTVAVALAGVLLALPFAGLGPRALWRRGWVVVVAAVPSGVFTALLGVDSGDVVWAWSVGGATLLDVTTGSLQSGLAIALRILAIGLPGVVLLATTDPTDLADSLAQDLHLPHRFVLAGLAGMRLFGVLAEEWQVLTQARRARGLGGGGRWSRLRTLGGQLFALLVLAVRRATVLSTAMEARGFGAVRERTWARRSRFTARDWAVVLGGVALAVLATTVGVLAGTWRLALVG
ncbi:energy-coupling factor transporter transmembrane component T family protein [Aquipuribacter sp. SD81]|uniref:energy-coupling factor transporter transmembrane component T family protein n=1 Tax=Aquipuribacter sp. SD81 TaxID=3127703 RepID=UPI003016903D